MDCPRILVIEDVTSVAMTYAAHLENAGYNPTIVSTGAAAIAELERSIRSMQAGGPEQGESISAVMLDLSLPDTDGLTLYIENIDIFRRIPVIIATADGTLPRASEAVRQGAFDYLIKPISEERLTKTVGKAVAQAEELKRMPLLVERTPREDDVPDTERSRAMQNLRRHIQYAAHSKAPALVYGELGSGRRSCAASIHAAGGRADNRFIVVNCKDRVMPTLEEEIFGITAGARPGIIANRIGALQMANGGTVYFDGIDQAPPGIQAGISEFIETGKFRRVGSARIEQADVRIIGGADTTIHKAVEQGRFHASLYYALVGHPLAVPALRERREDIIPLANHFIESDRQLGGRTPVSIDDSMMEGWSEYDWPGNLVELSTVVRQMAASFQLKAEQQGGTSEQQFTSEKAAG